MDWNYLYIDIVGGTMHTIINLIKTCYDWLFVETLDNEQRAILIVSIVIGSGCTLFIFGMLRGCYLLIQHLMEIL